VLSIVVASMFAVALPDTAWAQPRTGKAKKSAPTAVAGAVSPQRTAAGKRTIYGTMSYGVECVFGEMANTHSLGWITQNMILTIDFESGAESDPIATLSSIQFREGQAGGERFNSDDEGGDLNPYFRLVKDYAANWVLTIGAGDSGLACYSFKVTLQ
jgi:hypothetical protein